MLNIKEIAEQVSKRIYVEDGLLLSKFISEKFAEALIAEVAKQNEPVESQYKGSDGSWKSFDSKDHESNTRNSGDWEVRDLFTYPPTAEQIANETSWQPIETAPKGERFLTTTKLSNGSFGQVGISHSFFCYEVNTRDWKIAGDDPCATHWMPLPTPPKRSMEGV